MMLTSSLVIGLLCLIGGIGFVKYQQWRGAKNAENKGNKRILKDEEKVRKNEAKINTSSDDDIANRMRKYCRKDQ